MSQKNKRRVVKPKPPILLISLAIAMSFLALVQNKYGQFSDIKGFFQMHFVDGAHHWPFSTYTPIGTTNEIHAVEYPAITGIIMWLISFLIPQANLAWLHYYWVTATFHILLFAVSAYAVKSLANKKIAYAYVLAPAVLYSLYRNWDIWAIVPMLFAVIYFEEEKYRKSAILLAVSIATKFFPLVLLLPIAIHFLRKREIPEFLRYLVITVVTWLVINLPVAIVNFDGWAYFYQFNFRRGIGSGSFYEIFGKLGLSVNFPSLVFYGLNIGIFGLLTAFLFKTREALTLAESAFLTLFAFILFNKQYSMQYIIWLAPLAVVAISKVHERFSKKLIYSYLIWQVCEIAFQFSFFQNILTDLNRTDAPTVIDISGFSYGIISAIRYISALIFTFYIAKSLYQSKVEKSL